MTTSLKEFLSGMSILRLALYAAVALGVILIAFKIGDWRDDSSLDALRKENQELTREYNRLIGQSEAEEKRGDEKAAEAEKEKLRADAKDILIDQSNQNLKAKDAKMEQIIQKYDAQKGNLDCGPDGDCTDELRAELCALGYIKDCPKR